MFPVDSSEFGNAVQIWRWEDAPIEFRTQAIPGTFLVAFPPALVEDSEGFLDLFDVPPDGRGYFNKLTLHDGTLVVTFV